MVLNTLHHREYFIESYSIMRNIIPITLETHQDTGAYSLPRGIIQEVQRPGSEFKL